MDRYQPCGSVSNSPRVSSVRLISFFASGGSGRFGSRGAPTGRPMISHIALVGARIFDLGDLIELGKLVLQFERVL